MVSAITARHVKNACKATALATLISLSYGLLLEAVWSVAAAVAAAGAGGATVWIVAKSQARIASGLLHNLGSKSSYAGPVSGRHSWPDHFGRCLKRPHCEFGLISWNE